MRSLVTYRPALAPVDRWFDSVLADFARPLSTQVFGRAPVVDMQENEDGYQLEAELPGLTEKDFEVKVEGNLLTLVSKEAEETSETKDDEYVVRERRHSSFTRSFVLPRNADAIKATFENGMLSLAIPKSAASLQVV